ncbi:MAG: hypothetical protein GEV06_06695 [Luteitalea sp.]|nr:hypothetical protein [Luteitalea sp.]
MRHRLSRSRALADWHPTLHRVVRAAELECPRGHAEALSELIALAMRQVPSRGIFDPGARSEPELFAAIESVARAHLEFGDARAAWRKALKAAGLTLEQRDDIETAAGQVQAASDTAYYYAGLSFGLVFVYLSRGP